MRILVIRAGRHGGVVVAISPWEMREGV